MVTPSSNLSRIGLAGLAVMGQNLALNIAEKGFPISVYNRTTSKVDETVERAKVEGNLPLFGFHDPESFVKSIQKPRVIIMLVKAGAPVDQTIKTLSVFMEKGDCIIDGGNEWYENTERRQKAMEAGSLYPSPHFSFSVSLEQRDRALLSLSLSRAERPDSVPSVFMMEPTSSRICKRCGEPSVTYDLISNSRVCTSCGCEQDFDNFQFQPPGGFDAGPQGTFVHVGEFNYKEKKRYDARNQINDVASSLGFSAERTSELTDLIVQITQGEYGIGQWFSILIAACAHVIMRKNRLPLSISEIAAVTGSDLHEIGRMVRRVVEFMDLKLPEFDLIMALDRAIRTSDCFSSVPKEKLDEMVKQGRFLLQCSVKWFLTTGRQPLPMVAAVVAFVVELNQLGGPTIDDIAKEIHAGVSTSRQRYKELKETLVKVAQALPWGKNVTVKNLVGNASSILQYMAMKSKERTTLKSDPIMAFDLREVANECLKTEPEYTYDGYSVEKKDSMYFEVEDREEEAIGANCGDLEKLKISVDCLSRAYTDFLNGSDSLRLISGERGTEFGRKRKRGNDAVECNELWVGKLDLNKRLSLEQMINSNVGFDAFPPSFVSGEEACRRRKERIHAAKFRINEIIKPIANTSATKRVRILKKKLQDRKDCKEGAEGRQIDWEDCLIELLLLHRVKEEEIEQGNYKRLLDLYVFDSPFPLKAFTLCR